MRRAPVASVLSMFAVSAACFAQVAATAEPVGTLAVRAIQGTKGAPSVGAAEFELELFYRNKSVKQLNAMLDENGLALVSDLPVRLGVRPVVRIKYAGVLYQDAGPVMDAANPQAAMDVVVYETTGDAPPWRVQMRQLVAEPDESGVSVSETVVVENPADRTWIGGTPDSQGRLCTIIFGLPTDATDVRLNAGFHGWCCTSFHAGNLAVQMPLMPGIATYRFSYRVPGNRADLRVESPAPTDHAMFFVPDDGRIVEPTSTRALGADTVGSRRMRLYQADAIEPAQHAGVVIAAAAPAQTADRRVSWAAKSGIGIGSAILAGAVVLWFMRRHKLEGAVPQPRYPQD